VHIFYLKLFFSKKGIIINTIDSEHFGMKTSLPESIKKKYPFKISPNHSATFFLTEVQVIIDEFTKMSFLNKWFSQMYICTDDGRKFKPDISSQLKKRLKTVRNNNDFSPR